MPKSISILPIFFNFAWQQVAVCDEGLRPFKTPEVPDGASKAPPPMHEVTNKVRNFMHH
ncbi:hypothetical protein CIG11343_0637 [Campylobacter iguaniorum]|nr:hypothetical protein CIG11343_0637 [Campylobacter iguaniorum]